MKIAIHSDLHLEGYCLDKDFLANADFDVLVLAGDIVSYRTAECLNQVKKCVPDDKVVIFVPGNHEYYHGSIEEANICYQELCDKLDFFYGNRLTVTVDNVAFVCAVGWPDLQSFPQFDVNEKAGASSTMTTDFRVVRGRTIANMVEDGVIDKQYIADSLAAVKGVVDKVVVVTHFAPLETLGNLMFETSPLSAFFSNDYSDIVYEHVPDVWVFGHVHYNHDVRVYGTRFVSNQRGYRREHYCNADYDANKIIEV